MSAPDHTSRVASLRRQLTKLWVFSPEKLWLYSIALKDRGHWMLAFSVKQLNTLLYHNSLSPGASVSPDILLGHYGHGIVINEHVVIGRRVKIWHNVTLLAGRPSRSGDGYRGKIIIGDNVKIGANVVVVSARGRDLHIGSAARIGAGTVVTDDVPAKATVVSPRPRVILENGADADASGRDAQLQSSDPSMPERSAPMAPRDGGIIER